MNKQEMPECTRRQKLKLFDVPFQLETTGQGLILDN
ncbi:Uncharacterised protein [Legionella quateirensis]|uniref:Uncharacterized protein n=1 Tax=Legionella quateirensis TaxID=45072 RepID=A0A378L1E1_9GAMM|nr:Uncharacterised protein [Legionella quateirensis]